MKTMAYILTSALLSASLQAIAQPETPEVYRNGEVLVYSVKWNFIRLGRIIIRTSAEGDDTNFVRTVMTVESSPGLPFISISERNSTLIDRRTSKVREYRGVHRKGDDSISIAYDYDCTTRTLSFVEADLVKGTVTRDVTTGGIPAFVEGNALLVYARWRSRSGKSFRVPTVVDGKLGYTYLTFGGEVEHLELDDVPHDIPARKYRGFADWSGGTGAGLTGEFTGWVSDDLAAVPLRAEMKIALGSITIELERWNRPGWSPPGAVRLSRNGGEVDDE